MNAAIIVAAGLLLSGLLYFEKRENLTGKLLTKPFLSLLFIITAVVQPHPAPVYYRTMLVGLGLCLGGDVFLAIPGQNTFRLGLVSFLLGHGCYVIAFYRISQINWMTLAAGIVAFLVGISIYRWLRPNLGPMKVPVALYVIVISTMLCTAASVGLVSGLPASGKAMVMAGALLFYISDLFVARQRFIKAEFFNRLFGLPLYYTGQFLLAFSVGYTA